MTEKWRGEFEGRHQRSIQIREARIGRNKKKVSHKIEIEILESKKWVRLSPAEWKLLERLMGKNGEIGEIVSRETLMQATGIPNDNTLTVQINRLNSKLIHAQRLIGSLAVIVLPERGNGYVLYSTEKPVAFSLTHEKAFLKREKELFPNRR